LQVIFPNEANLRKLAENKGINVSSSTDLAELCKNQAIKDAVLSELNAVGKRSGLKPLEVSAHKPTQRICR
jgi:long-chain acyl-CoA synthetase